MFAPDGPFRSWIVRTSAVRSSNPTEPLASALYLGSACTGCAYRKQDCRADLSRLSPVCINDAVLCFACSNSRSRRPPALSCRRRKCGRLDAHAGYIRSAVVQPYWASRQRDMNDLLSVLYTDMSHELLLYHPINSTAHLSTPSPRLRALGLSDRQLPKRDLLALQLSPHVFLRSFKINSAQDEESSRSLTYPPADANLPLRSR